MKLGKDLRIKLFKALLSSFPRVDDLERLVYLDLGENLGQIAEGAAGQTIVIRLIQWCEAKGNLQDLVDAALRENPRNPELCDFITCYQQVTVAGVAQSSPAAQHNFATPPQEPKRHSFPEVCHFDMDVLIEECREAIYGKKGLVGLIIPCPEPLFQEHFCERLRQDLGRKATKKRQPLAIDVNITAEQVASRVRGFKSDLLRDYDVVCPLPIHIAQPGSKLPDAVWQALSEEFKNAEIKRQLIVVMFGGEKTVFPKGPIQVNPPLFKEMHVDTWVIKVSKALGWSEQAWEAWKRHIVANCVSDPACGHLEMWKIYDRLDLSVSLLKSYRVADDFLRELTNELQLRG